MTDPNTRAQSTRKGQRPPTPLVRVEFDSGTSATYDVPAMAIYLFEKQEKVSFREWYLSEDRDLSSAFRLAWLTVNCANPNKIRRDAEGGGEEFLKWLGHVRACDLVIEEADPTQQEPSDESPPSPAD